VTNHRIQKTMTLTASTESILKRSCVALVMCLFFASHGCQRSNEGKQSTIAGQPLNVVATTGMVADLVRQIGGDQVNVTQLMRSGVDPHLYNANRDDVLAVSKADLVFYNGLKLEGRMSDLLSKGARGAQHISLADAIPAEVILGDPEHQAADPHVWMDVSLWAKTTDRIILALSKERPNEKASFEHRANELRAKLTLLDELGMKWIHSIPEPQRVMITSHDAFRYFGRRYGLQVEGVQGVSTSSDASLRRVEELVRMLCEKKVPAAFVESSVPSKQVRSLVEGAAAQGWTVAIGGELFSDAMGPYGSGADTYIGMMLHNFRTIAKALGGSVQADDVKLQELESLSRSKESNP
jgi:manganese/zinc/iron transport system substrate-binding protein